MSPAAPIAPLALTMGDPAGIGAEITLKAWLSRHDPRGPLPAFIYYGDPALLDSSAELQGIDIQWQTVDRSADAGEIFEHAIPVRPVSLPVAAHSGRPDPANAPAVIESIDRAVGDALAESVGGVVTNPVAKSVLAAHGFGYHGHTDYLAALCPDGGRPPTPVMMLAGGDFRVVPLTVHIPLADVPHALSRDMIVNKARIVAGALAADFGIAQPRLAVCGLNPHAGEGGILGGEEERIIFPAIERLQAEGHDVTGPHSADTIFHESARAAYDAALCMYHDQALIPLKTLFFWEGVNCTLGLPFVRTSPDHGTAFDLAGTGRADARSLIAALRLAARMAAQRAGTSS